MDRVAKQNGKHTRDGVSRVGALLACAVAPQVKPALLIPVGRAEREISAVWSRVVDAARDRRAGYQAAAIGF